MGIFDMFKGKKNDIKSVNEFYVECVVDFHKSAQEYGVAKKGQILIPELIPIGEKTILAYLKDPFFQMEFGKEPAMYYYVIMSLCFQSGLVFGKQWHESYETLKNGYVEQIIAQGPADTAVKILTEMFPEQIAEAQGNSFCGKIYDRWIECHEPYWKLSDPRQYTFKAMLAAYQLGISMILEKYGY